MFGSKPFSLDASLPADVVLRRLESDAVDWPEARLSESARAAGMYGFAFQRKGNIVRIRPQMPWGIGSAPPLIFQGRILPRNTGSQITGEFRLGRLMLTYFAVLLLACSYFVVLFRAVPFFLLTLSITVAFAYAMRHSTYRSRDLARDETVALLHRAASPASAAGPPNGPLERPGVRAQANIDRANAGRSAPSR